MCTSLALTKFALLLIFNLKFLNYGCQINYRKLENG